jgi:hypothetical protein
MLKAVRAAEIQRPDFLKPCARHVIKVLRCLFLMKS